MQCLTYTVPPAFDGDTLQNFLRRDCGLSWRMVVRLKQVEGGMAVDGVPRRTIDRVRAGQTVTLRLPEDTVRIEGRIFPCLWCLRTTPSWWWINRPISPSIPPPASRSPPWPTPWWPTTPGRAPPCPSARPTAWIAIPAACFWPPRIPMWPMP